jgi:hypothetical protein
VGNNDHRWPDEHDRHDTDVSRDSLARLRHKLNVERPTRPSAKDVASKVETKHKSRAARKFAADNPRQIVQPRPSGDRFIRPAMSVKKAIVREVLSNPEASFAELRGAMDELGYRVSDLTLSTIKSETQFVIRIAQDLRLFKSVR